MHPEHHSSLQNGWEPARPTFLLSEAVGEGNPNKGNKQVISAASSKDLVWCLHSPLAALGKSFNQGPGLGRVRAFLDLSATAFAEPPMADPVTKH